ncbi:MAG: hypothetical protein ABJO02_04355 [Reichenbachiella sp.]|uniref:TolB family protein n=1 Tax=Reichenbachiella sp. TaxID=2184521 RepID=UPI0032982279
MKKNSLFFLILFAISFSTMAQLDAGFGQNPNKQEWQKLKSPKIDIVFPLGKEAQAQRIANLINYQGAELSATIGPIVKKPNLLLQTETVISNGFVGLAPFRSEFFSTPPANMKIFGAMGWLDILSIHEYRHVQQNNNSLHGFTKALRYIQGENGWAFGRVLVVPNWFMEGDAVWAETKFSTGGRGRVPHFTKEQRAIALSGNTYKYQKFRNGSFKTQLPSHYPTGYMLCSYLRNEEGTEVWNEILADATAWKSVLWSFNNAIKRNSTYRNSDQLFNASWQSMSEKWQEQRTAANVQPGETINKKRNTTTYYSFPQEISSGKLVAWKRSYQQTDQIVELSDGQERVLFSPGYNLWQYFNTRAGAFVWTELSQNPRRNNESYSDIYVKQSVDAPTQKITAKGNYFSPIFSNSTEEVFAVKYGSDLTPTIQKINLATGNVEDLKSFSTNEFIGRISFLEKENTIIAVYKDVNELTLIRIDASNGQFEEVIPRTKHSIDDVAIHNGYVYFTSSYSGIDNIFRTPLDGSKTIEQMSSEEVGAYNPTISKDGKTIYYTIFDELGNEVVQRPNKKLNPSDNFSYLEPVQMKWQDETPDIFESKGASIITEAPKNNYSTSTYSKSPFRGIQAHSWNLIPSSIAPGASLIMNNYTNDIAGQLSAGYNFNEEGAYFGTSLIYSRLFPVISINAKHNFRTSDFLLPADSLANVDYTETVVGSEITIPLKWLKNNYSTTLEPSVAYDYHITKNISEAGSDFQIDDINYTTLKEGISFSFLRRTARQNLAPRLGVTVSTSYTHNLTEKSNQKYTGIGKLFLPGIGRNHTLQLTAAYQHEPLSNVFQEVDLFQYSRGYKRPINDSFLRLSMDYGFTLFYPDLGFFGITYFKRIRANAFFDIGKGTIDQLDSELDYNSAGLEIIFDNTFLNLAPISVGLRGSYLLDTDPQKPENTFVTGLFISGIF